MRRAIIAVFGIRDRRALGVDMSSLYGLCLKLLKKGQESGGLFGSMTNFCQLFAAPVDGRDRMVYLEYFPESGDLILQASDSVKRSFERAWAMTPAQTSGKSESGNRISPRTLEDLKDVVERSEPLPMPGEFRGLRSTTGSGFDLLYQLKAPSDVSVPSDITYYKIDAWPADAERPRVDHSQLVSVAESIGSATSVVRVAVHPTGYGIVRWKDDYYATAWPSPERERVLTYMDRVKREKVFFDLRPSQQRVVQLRWEGSL